MRRIVASQRQATAGAVKLDTFFDRVMKYIPADIVGAWVALTGLVAGAAGIPTARVLWGVFAVMMAITFAWTLKQTAMEGAPPARMQAAISTGSFAVWVFALGGPFASLSWYAPVYGSIVLILYTLVVGLVVPGEAVHGGPARV
jgi:hypothetical protein